MILDVDLLSVLVCPQCRVPLEIVDENLITQLNEKIKSGEVRNIAGKPIGPVQGGLKCPGHGHVFPLRGGVPIMLNDESISLDGLSSN